MNTSCYTRERELLRARHIFVLTELVLYMNIGVSDCTGSVWAQSRVFLNIQVTEIPTQALPILLERYIKAVLVSVENKEFSLNGPCVLDRAQRNKGHITSGRLA